MSERKPTRDWLLARHASSVARLDALRRQSLPSDSFGDLLRDVFLPDRKIWRALAAVWIALLGFHAVGRYRRPAASISAPTPAAIAPWFNQLKSDAIFAQTDRRP